MAIYKVKEIAEKLGVKPQTINTWKKRGKLIIANGYFDDQHPVNKEFLENRKPINFKTVEENIQKKAAEKLEELDTLKNKMNNSSDNDENPEYKTISRLNKLKAEKLLEEIEFLKLKNKKQSGELISLEHSKIIFNIHITNIVATFYNMVDNYTSDLCNKLGADREILAIFRGKLKKMINTSTSSAKIQSIKDLKSLAENLEEDETNE